VQNVFAKVAVAASLGVLGALLMAGPAQAFTNYTGRVAGEPTSRVSFKLREYGRTVDDFRVQNLAVDCDGVARTADSPISDSVDVNQEVKRFFGQARGGGTAFSFLGELARGEATGTLRLRTVIDGTVCHSGSVNFRAIRR
jgi:hypothetical protein